VLPIPRKMNVECWVEKTGCICGWVWIVGIFLDGSMVQDGSWEKGSTGSIGRVVIGKQTVPCWSVEGVTPV